jgi:hypothetical protein
LVPLSIQVWAHRRRGVPRSKTQSVLLATGFGGLLFVLSYIVLGGMAPGYHATRETISALEFIAVGLGTKWAAGVFNKLVPVELQ